jgi:hypothetical protein
LIELFTRGIKQKYEVVMKIRLELGAGLNQDKGYAMDLDRFMVLTKLAIAAGQSMKN